MPTVFTHAVAGAALAQALAPGKRLRAYTLLAAAAAVLPDADALGLRLGLHYGSLLGHRGLTHSLLFAAAAGAAAAVLFPRARIDAAARWRLAACIAAATASHGILDAFTDGGSGVAFFAPFDTQRYFFPATPIRVAPMRATALFSPRGAAVLASEMLWVWLPAGVLALAARVFRKL